MIRDFYGNAEVRETLEHLLETRRIPQTILLAGPAGAGKATLARRFASALIGDTAQIERDDLSLPDNQAVVADREKWPAEKRNEDPLLFASHPDFVTFAPDGPMRQISIPQMRLLKERAQYKPLRGRYRVFLIDHLDRANEQAANSLLKTLEEPPEHLILISTAENSYDLLPTIRSRSVIFELAAPSDEETIAFLRARNASAPERRARLSGGSPGVAVSLDLETYDRRRAGMLALLQSASGRASFEKWVQYTESGASSRSDRLEDQLKALYLLLEDILLLQHQSGPLRNEDVRGDLEPIARIVSFEWVRAAVRKLDELVEFMRRNIQKNPALDALVLHLRAQCGAS